MLTTIKGTFSNGVVVLKEQPPHTTKSEVLVTFTEEFINDKEQPKQRKAGFAKEYINYVDTNFDDPINDFFFV